MDRCKELLEQLSQELEFHHERLQSLQAENRNLKELHEAPPIDHLVTSTSINLAKSFPPAGAPAGRQSQVSFAGDLRSPRSSHQRSPRSSHQHRRSAGFASESSGTRSLMVRITAEEQLHRLAQRTKQFSAEKPWYVINPDSNWFATCWQCATFVGLIFVALITPIQVGLLQLHFDTLFVVSLFVDLIFFVDMFLQFCTAYSKRTVRGVEWEVRMHRIVAQYLKTWFCLDFITLIPFDLMMATGGEDSVVAELKTVKVIRILRLLKLMRLLKSSRIIHKLEIPMAIPYQQMALIRFLLVLGLVCHWLACLWALTLQLSDDQSPKWIDGIRESDQVNQNQISNVYIYLSAFYFCSYTMTSVGYGDLGPKNMTERTVCTMMILTAGLCWAYVLGEVCGIVTEMSIDSQRFRKRMHQLNAMMDHQDLPKALRLRLRSFFLQNRYQAFYLTQQELLKEMSPQLQSEVCTALHLPWIEKVSFLQQFMKLIRFQEGKGVHIGPYHACIADISRELKSVAYAQQESFENVQVLFILSKGLVALDNRIGHNGTVWGEDFVLSDLSLIRPVDAFALTYVEVMCLSREGLMTVVERRKRTCPYLGRLVRRYCVRMAASRGLLAEAKRRTRLTRLSKLRSTAAAPRSTVTSATVASALSETPAPPTEPVVPLLPDPPERAERAERHEAPEAPEAPEAESEASCSVTLPQVPMQLRELR